MLASFGGGSANRAIGLSRKTDIGSTLGYPQMLQSMVRGSKPAWPRLSTEKTRGVGP